MTEHCVQEIPRRDLKHELDRMSADGWTLVTADATHRPMWHLIWKREPRMTLKQALFGKQD